MTSLHPRSLFDIAEAAIATTDGRSDRQREILQRLRRQAERLSSNRFQLAVLGQFKRGKSTLLNAMLGQPLLATGILPLTAIPTFMAGGEEPEIALAYRDGRKERKKAADWRELSREIAAATTEEQNPGNVRGLSHVDVMVPSQRWLESMVLIDTPGVGSTYRHNTVAAEAVLPECDAALFVVSHDPPITEVELRYLGEICRAVSHVVVVLNKVDLVEDDDRERVLSFLRTVLAETHLPQMDPNIFPVSAKLALDARLHDRPAELARSGLGGLESYIRQRLMRQKAELLEASALRNIQACISELRNDVDLNRHALALPLEELDRNIAIFESAVKGLQAELQSLDDLLTGEWRRSLALLDDIVLGGERQLGAALDAKLDAILQSEASEDVQQSMLDRAMSELFDEELGAVIDRIGSHIENAVAQHGQRYQALIQRVYETAAKLLLVHGSPPQPQEHFAPIRQPYWTTKGTAESLGSVTRDWLSLLLSRRARERRRLGMVRKSAKAAIGRNIANLHWATRQNIDDNFRRLLSSCRQSVENSIAQAREILSSARDRRRAEDTSVRLDIERLKRIAAQLKDLERDLPGTQTSIS